MSFYRPFARADCACCHVSVCDGVDVHEASIDVVEFVVADASALKGGHWGRLDLAARLGKWTLDTWMKAKECFRAAWGGGQDVEYFGTAVSAAYTLSTPTIHLSPLP